MHVVNGTSQGTRYTVAGGGSGTPITPPPGTILTGYLQPGEEKELMVRGSGPWKIMFLPEGGDDRIVVEAYSSKDRVELCLRSGRLCDE